MQLTPNFTLDELIYSPTATAKGIDNDPSDVEITRLRDLCTLCLQPIRNLFGSGIKVTSGFRSKALNAATKGSSPTSSHCYGYAADIKPTTLPMARLQRTVLRWANHPDSLFDQVILEHTDANGIATWIHIGVRRGQNNAQRRQILYTEDGKTYRQVLNDSIFVHV